MPLDPEFDTLSFSFLTITESLSVSQSVEATFDSLKSPTFIIHYFVWVTLFPVYVQVRSQVMPVILFSEEEGKEPLSNAVIIGTATGVGATIAILAGIVVFMFRHRRDQNRSWGSSSSVQCDQTTVSAVPTVADASHEEPPSTGYCDDEQAIESLSNFNMNDIEDQPPIWI
jgi:hypothetical protein